MSLFHVSTYRSHTSSNAFFSPSIYMYVFSFFFFVLPCMSFAKFHNILLFVLAFSIISCSQFPFLFPRYIDVLLFWFSYFLFNNRSSLWGAFIFLALLHVLFFIRLNSIILFPFLSIHGAAPC